jgi:hypothetical protein
LTDTFELELSDVIDAELVDDDEPAGSGPRFDPRATDRIGAILGGDLMSAMSSAFAAMKWAEDEIARAMRRHPDQADPIWHSFLLLQPHHDVVSATERNYRAHCRELLERVAAGEDTRPGTAMECIAVLRDTSLVAPLNATGFGLYMRVWDKAGLPAVLPGPFEREHYEAIRGEQIDDAEYSTRRKLTQPERRLPNVLAHRAHCPAGITANTAAALPVPRPPAPLESVDLTASQQLVLL